MNKDAKNIKYKLKHSSVIRLWRLSPNKGLFFIQIILQVILTYFAIYISKLSQKAIDDQFVLHSTFQVIISFVLITIGGIAAQYFSGMLSNLYAIAFTQKLREESLDKILHCHFSYIEKNHSGTILNKMSNDVEHVSEYFSFQLPILVRDTVSFVLTFVYLMTINWMMTCICAVCVPIAVRITKKFADPTYEVMEQFYGEMDDLTIMAKDSVTKAKTEKAYNLHKLRVSEFNQKMDRATKVYVSFEKLMARSGAYKYLLKSAPTIICILIAFVTASFGKITNGSFAAFILLMGNITKPLSQFIGYITDYKEVEVSMNRILEILDLPSEEEYFIAEDKTNVERQYQTKENTLLGNQQPCFKFNNVCFTYDDNEDSSQGTSHCEDKTEFILNHLNGSIKQGEMTAIVGKSGGGKSTLFKLMTGLYPISSGEIKLFGVTLNQLSLDQIREQIAYVEQMPVLIQGTIADNIGMGKPDATLDEIIHAAKMAYAHEFILQQPNGYQTILQENGMNLSGGQRQRIAIARAFIKNAPILLMDEMTSALDTESEKLIQLATNAYRKNKTVVMIAHRLSTIQSADHIMVLDHGEFVEEGKHEELLKRNGIYTSLYHKLSDTKTKNKDVFEIQREEGEIL